MKPFTTMIVLKNGESLDAEVRLEWLKKFGDDYDFDFSVWYRDQQVLDENIHPSELTRIMYLVDERIQ